MHFPLNKTVSGLASLCSSLFGVEVAVSVAPANETWMVTQNQSRSQSRNQNQRGEEVAASQSGELVLKLSLKHKDEGALGDIYLDLMPREGE